MGNTLPYFSLKPFLVSFESCCSVYRDADEVCSRNIFYCETVIHCLGYILPLYISESGRQNMNWFSLEFLVSSTVYAFLVGFFKINNSLFARDSCLIIKCPYKLLTWKLPLVRTSPQTYERLLTVYEFPSKIACLILRFIFSPPSSLSSGEPSTVEPVSFNISA